MNMQSSKERNSYGQMKRYIESDVLRGVLLLMMSAIIRPHRCAALPTSHWGSSAPLNALFSSQHFLPVWSFANVRES
jgi:hypothetical protein